VRLTWFLTSRDEYVRELGDIGTAYREVMGKNFPVMSVVQVVALMEAQAKVEIEATAVVPSA
jgi:enamine deaminase RidA (YjgF/YER057c/UK114 family)